MHYLKCHCPPNLHQKSQNFSLKILHHLLLICLDEVAILQFFITDIQIRDIFFLYCRKCLFQTLYIYLHNSGQKHPPRGVPRKKCYENMKQMYRQFREHPALWHGCSPVNLLHIFRTPFLKNTSGWLLLSGCLFSIPLHFSKTYIAAKVSSNALLGF